MSKKQRILTGITTSGIPHLGNLSGAILPAINASNDEHTSSFLFLADYHSLIKNLDPSLTHDSSFEIAACWLACGLNPEKVTFYRQSDIPHIFELTWILSCLSAKGLLNRAHAYKAAVAENETVGSKDLDKGITMGLFNYPVLMAADILMFNANIVPVGQDQKQHIEMTRDIATRFNHHYGDIFTIPEALIDDEKGVLPGLDGQKMSKSYNNDIDIFLSDNKLRKQILGIKTDSTPMEEPKETENCNVFKLYKLLSSDEKTAQLRSKYEGGNFGYGHAKQELFELICVNFSAEREKFKHLMENKNIIEEQLQKGAEKARVIAREVLTRVRTNIGY